MINIYGKEACSYCVKAVELCNTLDLEFNYTDVSKDQSALDKIRTMGLRTVPQIWIGENHIGGYQELYQHLSTQ